MMIFIDLKTSCMGSSQADFSNIQQNHCCRNIGWFFQRVSFSPVNIKHKCLCKKKNKQIYEENCILGLIFFVRIKEQQIGGMFYIVLKNLNLTGIKRRKIRLVRDKAMPYKFQFDFVQRIVSMWITSRGFFLFGIGVKEHLFMVLFIGFLKRVYKMI